MLTGFLSKSSEPGCAFSFLKAFQGVFVWVDPVLTVPAEESASLVSLSSPDFQGKPRPSEHSDEYPGVPSLCPLCEDTPPPVAQPHCPANRVPWLRHSAGVLMAAGPGRGSASPRTHIPPGTEPSPRLEPSLQGPGCLCCWRREGLKSFAVSGSLSAFSCLSSTRCHILRCNDEELNSNFPVSLCTFSSALALESPGAQSALPAASN